MAGRDEPSFDSRPICDRLSTDTPWNPSRAARPAAESPQAAGRAKVILARPFATVASAARRQDFTAAPNLYLDSLCVAGERGAARCLRSRRWGLRLRSALPNSRPSCKCRVLRIGSISSEVYGMVHPTCLARCVSAVRTLLRRHRLVARWPVDRRHLAAHRADVGRELPAVVYAVEENPEAVVPEARM